LEQKGIHIEKPKGKLGVLIPGLGAVGTTFIAGVEAIIQKHCLPYGSLTQMGTVRLGKQTSKTSSSARGIYSKTTATRRPKKPAS
jgi:myo-inositol-1-phosphate synthase